MSHTSPLPLRVALDTSLVPAREEFEEALSILTATHQADPARLAQILSVLQFLVEQRQENYLQLPPTLRTTLIHLYKVPEKRQGTQAFYRRVAAKIYCYSGSTYGRLQTYCKQYKLKFKTNECEFRNTIISIITEAYRSIEQKVIKNFEVLEIKALDERQVKDIEPILYHLETNISRAGAEVFKQEIKSLFTLERTEETDLTLCYQFYHELREKMEVRQAELGPEARFVEAENSRCKDRDVFQANPAFLEFYYDLTPYKEIPKHHYVKEDDPQVWTVLVEHEIVALFLEHREVAKVGECLRLKYGSHPDLTCGRRLKCKLIKIIRGSVRLLQLFYRQRLEDVAPPLPKMMEIDEDKVKLLIGSPFEIKACLLEFFRQPIMSYRTLCEIVNEINVFIREKSLLRFQKSTASKAIIFSL